MPKMFPDPDDDRLDELPEAIPVATRSPGWSPLTTTVFVPSLIPVWMGTDTGAPFRITMTLVPVRVPPEVCANESAELGTVIALSTCWVMMLTVAVMSGSIVTSVLSTDTSTLYVTTLDVVVPAGRMLATVPLKVRFG
jgi:hypothetical protein